MDRNPSSAGSRNRTSTSKNTNAWRLPGPQECPGPAQDVRRVPEAANDRGQKNRAKLFADEKAAEAKAAAASKSADS